VKTNPPIKTKNTDRRWVRLSGNLSFGLSQVCRFLPQDWCSGEEDYFYSEKTVSEVANEIGIQKINN